MNDWNTTTLKSRLHSVAYLIQPRCYMTNIDLKDAYYSVKISVEDSKYLKFYVGKNIWKFVVLPNGLSSGPRKFTKLTKPATACLRIEGVIVAIYIDDIIVIRNNLSRICFQFKGNVSYTYQ